MAINGILRLSCFSILRWCHLVAAAELFVEGGTVGKAAHFGDEGDRFIGLCQQTGSVIHAVAVDKGIGAQGIRTLADGFIDIAVVGGEHRGQRVAVQFGIGIGLLFRHQFYKAEEDLLARRALLFGLTDQSLDFAHFAELLMLNQVIQFAILDDFAAVSNGQTPQSHKDDNHDGEEREGKDAIYGNLSLGFL